MIEVRINHLAPHVVECNPYPVRGFVSWCIKIKDIRIANMVEYDKDFATVADQDYRFVLAYRVLYEIRMIISINNGALSQVVIPTIGEIVAVISRSSR